MPRARTLSRRNVRGMGSMKKGNLEDGCFWFNIKRAYFGTNSFTRGGRFNEKLTLWELYDEVVRDATAEEADWNLPEGWYIDAQFKRGKSLSDDIYEEELVKDHFLGAETIHVKVFDENGEQRVYNNRQWDFHVPGAKRAANPDDLFYHLMGY